MDGEALSSSFTDAVLASYGDDDSDDRAGDCDTVDTEADEQESLYRSSKKRRVEKGRRSTSSSTSGSGHFKKSWNLPFIEASKKGSRYVYTVSYVDAIFLLPMVDRMMLSDTVNHLDIKRSIVSHKLTQQSQHFLKNLAFLIVPK